MSPTVDGSSKSIRFANGNVANLVAGDSPEQAAALLDALAVKPCDFVLLLVGAAPEVPAAPDVALEQLTPPLLALLAGLGRSVVLGTGTRNWLTAPLHQRKAGKAPQVSLLGVAPAALVSYPSNPGEAVENVPPRQLDSWHSDFILVDSEERWGSQLPMLHAVVTALSSRAERVPVLALLAGEGLCMAEETLAVVRNGIPLAVMQGSGGLADEIASALAAGNATPNDEQVAEIIAEGQITVLTQSNFPEELARLIGQARTPDEVLSQAWENFAVYDLNANYQQRQSDRITLSIISLGVVGALLAVLQQVLYAGVSTPFNLALNRIVDAKTFWPWLLHYSLLVLPILLTVLIGAAYKFKISSKWFVLRAGAEALKSEIYAYRTRALDYQRNAAQQLAVRMGEIMKRTMLSEANSSHLREYDKALGLPPNMDGAGGGDSGFGYLPPERYVEVRLEDQLRYFRKRTRRLDRQFRVIYWLTLIIGGVTTLLAAISQREQIWIAVTVPLTTALGMFLNYRQTESNLLKFNQAVADLDSIKSWWLALPPAEKSRQRNIDLLVQRTETVLQAELDGWVEQMKNALADLQKHFDATAEEAKTWKPKVEYRSHTAAERTAAAGEMAAAPAPAAALAEVHITERSQPQEAPATVELSLSTRAPDSPAPAGDEAPVQAAPAGVDIALKVTSPPANAVAPKPKVHWETAEITPDTLRNAVLNKGYKWFDDQPNIIGIRSTAYEKNTFGDRLFCCWVQPDAPAGLSLQAQQKFLADWAYKGPNGQLIIADGKEGPTTDFALAELAKHAGKERLQCWAVTTRPGTVYLNKGGCAILVPGQYKGAYQLGLHRQNPQHPALVQRGEMTIYRDSNRNDIAEEGGKKVRGFFGINIHRAGNDSTFVNDWSAGCQVFKRTAEHADLLRICRHFKVKNFTYTLLHEADLA
jgi:hypothetical protein